MLEIMFLPFYLVFLCIHLFCYILFCFASLLFYRYIIPGIFVSVQAMSKLNFTWKEHSLHIRKQSLLLDSSTCVILSGTNPYLSKGSILCLESRSSLFMDLTHGTTTFLRYLTTHLTLLSYFWTSYTQSQSLSLLL